MSAEHQLSPIEHPLGPVEPGSLAEPPTITAPNDLVADIDVEWDSIAAIQHGDAS